MPREVEMGGASLDGEQADGLTGFHRTPEGRVSMNPTKWRVAQVVYQSVDPMGVVNRTFASYGVFAPYSFHPTISFPTHSKAMDRAQKYGFFKVVPPQEDSE
jgi:hypothetical protein